MLSGIKYLYKNRLNIRSKRRGFFLISLEIQLTVCSFTCGLEGVLLFNGSNSSQDIAL